MARLIAAIAALAISTGVVLAQESGGAESSETKPAQEERILLDRAGFRALFEGKTIHLSAGGRYFGSEYYKKGDRSVWVQVGRPCMPGVWWYEKPHFCFRYDNSGPHCWTVFRRGEKFFAQSVDGFELSIDAVDEKPLSCSPELLS